MVTSLPLTTCFHTGDIINDCKKAVAPTRVSSALSTAHSAANSSDSHACAELDFGEDFFLGAGGDLEEGVVGDLGELGGGVGDFGGGGDLGGLPGVPNLSRSVD